MTRMTHAGVGFGDVNVEIPDNLSVDPLWQFIYTNLIVSPYFGVSIHVTTLLE